jgi:hypothetical protein
MSTTHVVMGLLAGGPKHGYDLKRAHDVRLPRAKPLAFGQVYATLGRLVRDAGLAALMTWMRTVEPPMPHLGGTLLTKVVVTLLVAGVDQARGYLAAQREAHVARLRELTAVKTDPVATLGDVIAADYGIAHLDADLRWLTTTLERVADLHREVTAP